MTTKKSYEELEKENKQLKNKIEQIDTQYHDIFENSTIGLYRTTPSGEILYVNNTLVKMLSFNSKEELKKRNVKTNGYVNPNKRIEFQKILHKNGFVIGFESAWKCQDNTILYLKENARAIKNKNGEIAYYDGSIIDITNEKKAEEKLRKSEKNFRTLIENISDLIFMIDPDMKIITLNKAALKVIGGDLEQNIGKDISDKFSSKLLNNYKISIEKVLKNSKSNVIDSVLQTKDCTTFFNTKLNPVFDEKGKIIAVIGVSRDITYHKKIEEILKEKEKKLHESNKTKDKFFSIIAHDLKSPFSAMLSFSEILSENFDEYNNESKKDFIETINKGLKDSYKLLENLLYWSRSQRGVIKFKPEKINLLLFTTEIIEILDQSARNKSIDLTNKISKNIYVEADKDMLSTIIRNLLSNAIKFTPKNGYVSIEVRKKYNFAEIIIEDSGIGVPIETQSKLFDISENTSTMGTENETGTGLGLILCKEFVEKHGGKIWFNSELKNGSSFYFTIPSM